MRLSIVGFFWLLSSICLAEEVRLSAAASLTDLITQLAQHYEKAHPGVHIKKSFGGSSILAKQIEQGAPVDIFISADADWMDYLTSRQLLLADTRVDFLANQLVLVVPQSSAIKTVRFDKSFQLPLTPSGKFCGGDPAAVPAGKYAKQALAFYGWWDSVSTRWVAAEDVRTALNFVERKECEMGVVYRSDALASQKVNILGEFPVESHKAIRYPLALTKNSGQEARAFALYLQSDQARQLAWQLGFMPLGPNTTTP